MTAGTPTAAPFGSWVSPISADLIVGSTIGVGPVGIDGGDIYWMEFRPTEGGRTVTVRYRDGVAEDVTPEGFNVRTRAHEYGGGAELVSNGEIFFVNFADQRIYRQRPGEAPQAVTEEGKWAFADMCHDAARDRLICVREDHSGDGEPRNELVAVALGDGAVTVLDGSHDFVSGPRLDAVGERLCWLSWDHPDMPWDATTLWTADIDAGGALSTPQAVAGGPGESVFQPEWAPDGGLVFVSDRSGWWNLYRADDTGMQPLCPDEAEYGLPQWVFGMVTYAIDDDGSIVAMRGQAGTWQLGTIAGGSFTPFDLPFTDISGLCVSRGMALFTGASAAEAPRLVRLDLGSGEVETLRRSSSMDLDPGYLSAPQAIYFPTAGGMTAHGFYYPPANKDFTGAPDELPPVVLRGHGGPTAAAGSSLNVGFQYWTSRGFGVFDVNYRGSTGFGRKYREALYGQWGVADVEDMVAAADYLVGQGLADPQRLAIRGGSAGGYTTLAALAFTDTFAAGASQYGIGDLMALARDTHKFESRYLDRIVAPLPEGEALYRERSPINHTDRLDCPVIFLQGLDDKVVPPNQAEAMVAALDAKGIPVAYIAFEGEGHGFRKAENVKRALESELAFYGRIFRFAPADDLPPLEIRNLPAP